MMFIEIDNPITERGVIGYTVGQNFVVHHLHYVMRVTGPLYLGLSKENGKVVHKLFLFYDDQNAGLKLGPISLRDDIEEYMKTHITGRYDTPENLLATLRKDMAANKHIDSNLLAFAKQYSQSGSSGNSIAADSMGFRRLWKEASEMEKAGVKTRDIQFFSPKNNQMVCVHTRQARDYAKYLEEQPWVAGYEAGCPLEAERYAHVNPVGIRGSYFQTALETLIFDRAGYHRYPQLSAAIRRYLAALLCGRGYRS